MNTFKSLVSLLLFSIALTISAQTPQTPSEMTELGKTYYENNDYKNAVKWFKKAAKKGDSDGLYYLGLCFYNGQGVKKDEIKAREYFINLAQQGNIEAMYYAGLCLESKDLDKAINYLMNAAIKGNEKAFNKIMDMDQDLYKKVCDYADYGYPDFRYVFLRFVYNFLNQIDTSKRACEYVIVQHRPGNYDYLKTFWKLLIIKYGNDKLFEIAKSLRPSSLTNSTSKEKEKDFYNNLLMPLARNGCYEAADCIWRDCEFGEEANEARNIMRILARENPEIRKLYIENAMVYGGPSTNDLINFCKSYSEAGDTYCTYALGLLYLKNNQLGKAQDCLVKAYEHQNEFDEVQIHNMKTGLSILQEKLGPYATQQELIETARLGNPESEFNYAEYLLYRDKRDEAAVWYKKAAEQGYPPAIYAYAEYYERDNQEKLSLYKKSAENGFGPAQKKMGEIYYESAEKHEGYDQEKLSLYKKSAENGYLPAQKKMGMIYYYNFDGYDLRGNYVSQKREALKWFTMAANQGDEEAKEYIGFCELAIERGPDKPKQKPSWGRGMHINDFLSRNNCRLEEYVGRWGDNGYTWRNCYRITFKGNTFYVFVNENNEVNRVLDHRPSPVEFY